MNKTELTGRLIADPDLKFTPGEGIPVVTFKLAVDRPRTKNKTDFIKVVAWRSTAEYVANYGTKGRLIELVGFITTNTYEVEGSKRYETFVTAEELKFLDKKKDGAPGPKEPEENYGDMTQVDEEGDVPF